MVFQSIIPFLREKPDIPAGNCAENKTPPAPFFAYRKKAQDSQSLGLSFILLD